MSDVPNLTAEQVAQLVPQASDLEALGAGGQKVVFKGTIDDQNLLYFSEEFMVGRDLRPVLSVKIL